MKTAGILQPKQHHVPQQFQGDSACRNLQLVRCPVICSLVCQRFVLRKHSTLSYCSTWNKSHHFYTFSSHTKWYWVINSKSALKPYLRYLLNPAYASIQTGREGSYASYIHVPTAVTIPRGTGSHKICTVLSMFSGTHDGRHPDDVDAAREFSLALYTESQVETHPHPSTSTPWCYTHSHGHLWYMLRAGNTAELLMRGEAMVTVLIGGKPQCKSHTRHIRLPRCIQEPPI